MVDCFFFKADRHISDHDHGWVTFIDTPDGQVEWWHEDGKEAVAAALRWAVARGVELRLKTREPS